MAEKQDFAGYRVAIGCFIIMFVHSGMLTTIGLFIPIFAREFTLDPGLVVLIVSFATGAAFFANFAVPKALSTIGAKKTLFIATSLCALHYVVFYLSNGLLMLYVAGAIGGLVLGFGAQACMAAVISSWFIEKRATVIGMVFGGSAFGSAVCLFLTGNLIQQFGWRNAYLVNAVIILVLGFGANIFFIRTPESMGQKALGWDKQGGSAATPGAAAQPLGVDLPTARGTMSFWLIMLGVLLSGMLITGWQSFAPAFWQSSGIEQIRSSNYASLFSLIGAAAMLYSGVVADKFGNKVYLSYLIAAFIAGTILLIQFTNVSTAMSVGTILICGLSFPLSSSVPATVTTDSFGRAFYTQIMSSFTAMLYLGKCVGPATMGYFRRSFGFAGAYWVLIAAAAVSLVILIIAVNIAPMRKLRAAAQQNAGAVGAKAS
ncbi:MAG: MFS transporter [Synergistaceae bacterium]|nr:MFS transporter [Synergistaceae bacterium]